jgi:hypothetical protein
MNVSCLRHQEKERESTQEAALAPVNRSPASLYPAARRRHQGACGAYQRQHDRGILRGIVAPHLRMERSGFQQNRHTEHHEQSLLHSFRPLQCVRRLLSRQSHAPLNWPSWPFSYHHGAE